MAMMEKDTEMDAKRIEDMHEGAIHSDRPAHETREPYCKPGIRGIFGSYYVALCALFSAMGGLLFG